MLNTCKCLPILDRLFNMLNLFLLKMFKAVVHNTQYKKQVMKFMDMKKIDDGLKHFFIESYIEEIINFKFLYKINVIIFTLVSWFNFILASAITLLLGITNSRYISEEVQNVFNWVALISSTLLIIGNRIKVSGDYERQYLTNLTNAYLMESEIRLYLGKISKEYVALDDEKGIRYCMMHLEYIKKNSMIKNEEENTHVVATTDT